MKKEEKQRLILLLENIVAVNSIIVDLHEIKILEKVNYEIRAKLKNLAETEKEGGTGNGKQRRQ